MGAADRSHRQPGRAREGRQAAEAAAMMFIMESIDYSEPEWNDIKTVVRDGLGLDADRIERQITPVIGEGDYQFSTTGMESLRERIQTAASVYIAFSALERQMAGRKARIKVLTAVRDDAVTLREKIIAALATTIGVKGRLANAVRVPLLGVDPDMLSSTERFIAKLNSNVERMIATLENAHTTVNSSKTGRDMFWSRALAIWIDIGGKETGVHTADFLIAVSKPVFRKLRTEDGRKTTASMPQSRESVVEWLRLRAKARKATTS
jgi:hypothetical protein